MSYTLLGIRTENQSKKDILEKIKKNILSGKEFFHVVSLNPENLVVAQENEEFKKVVNTAQMRIVDGMGVLIGAKVLGIQLQTRMTGVDLMETLLNDPIMQRLPVALIGGNGNLANNIAECYQRIWPQAKFVGFEGVKNIREASFEEEKKLFSIVADMRPRLIFVAFGSPFQELWIHKNRHRFGTAVVIGVGGAFDFLGGRIMRAPQLMRKIGLEWLFRLLRQPWRIKRQLRLFTFIKLILQEKLRK